LALTSAVVLLMRSRTKTSVRPFVSLSTKSLALLSKQAYRPFVEIPVGIESPFPPPVPVKFTLTKVVVPAARSRKKILRCGATSTGSALPLLVVTRLLAALEKSTKRPSALRIGPQESPLPPAGGAWEESRTETSWKGAAAVERIKVAKSAQTVARG